MKFNLKNKNFWLDRDKLKMAISPHRDWKIMFIIFTVVLAVFSMASVYFHQQVIHSEFNDLVSGEEDSLTINRAEFDNVVENYRNKRIIFEELLLNKKQEMVDPSR